MPGSCGRKEDGKKKKKKMQQILKTNKQTKNIMANVQRR